MLIFFSSSRLTRPCSHNVSNYTLQRRQDYQFSFFENIFADNWQCFTEYMRTILDTLILGECHDLCEITLEKSFAISPDPLERTS